MLADLDALREALDADPTLTSLLGIARARLDDDPGHDLEHALRVTLWTHRLGGGELDLRLVVPAGLFHDLVNLPKNHPERALASERSAEAAAGLLREHGYDEAAIQLIGDAITDHSYSRGAVPRSLLGRALQDADRLEALGVLGMFRTISTGSRMNARYFHATDPWARSRPLDDLAYSVDHFPVKLFRLPTTLCTEAGRREAERRVTRMKQMLVDLGDELSSPYVGHPSPDAR